MLEPSGKNLEQRVLILTPTAKEAGTTERIFSDAGLQPHICQSLDELCDLAMQGAAAALLTEEAIMADSKRCLRRLLEHQPPWSDFPLIVLTRAGLDLRATFPDLQEVGNMTLLTRPVQIAGLVSTVQAAVRDRQRQYALRTYLQERAQVEDALKEAAQHKDEFLAMLAHELRNPLAAAHSAAQLLRCEVSAGAEQPWALEVLERQLTQLTRLIDDLLDVSRITQGKIQLRCEVLDLSALVQRAVESVRTMIEACQHSFSLTIASNGPLWVEGDQARLEQVIANLLTNACKYTREGGRIQLFIEQTADEAIVRVKDNGIGISAEMLPKIFEVFTQVERSLDRAQGGLGIGLTIVRRLLQMHGGSVSAHSRGEGQGSEFFVRLPLVAAPTPPACAGDDVSEPTVLKSILVVDDNRDSATTLAMLLRMSGHDVAVAGDAEEALRTVETFSPEIGLLDIGLPGMDGYELARRLRKQGHDKTVLIALSGYGQPDDRRRSLDAGFDHHLIKPVNMRELTALLANGGG